VALPDPIEFDASMLGSVQGLDFGPGIHGIEAAKWLKTPMVHPSDECAEAYIASGRCKVWLFPDGTSEIVGFGSLGPNIRKRHVAMIPWMAVCAPHRKRGYAREIMEYLIAVAFENPVYTTVALFVSPDNVPAIGLYTSLNFAGPLGHFTDDATGIVYDRMAVTLPPREPNAG
jgi:GNAT superfamily N-acetyltransferase